MIRQMITALLCLMSMAVSAGDNLFVAEDVVWAKDGQCELVIGLTNEDDVTGMQFDLYLPDGITIQKNERGREVTQTTERLDKVSVICKHLEGNRYRFVIFSMRAKPLAGNSGALFSIPLEKTDAVKKGDYVARFTGINLSVVLDNKNTNCVVGPHELKIKVK